MNRQLMGKLISLMILVVGFSLAQAQSDDGANEGQRDFRSEKMHGERGHSDRSGFGKFDQSHRIERMIRYLELDDTQAQTMRNIMAAAGPELSQLQDSLQENRDALRKLDPNESEYDINLQNLSMSVGEQASRLALLMGRIRADINAVLTPDQRQQFQDLGEQNRDHGRRGHDRSKGEAVRR